MELGSNSGRGERRPTQSEASSPSVTAGVGDAEVRRALDERFVEMLKPATAGLALLFAGFVVADYYTMREPVNRWTAAANVGMMLVFLATHLVLRIDGVQPKNAHQLAMVLALLILANSLFAFYWLNDPGQTVYLLLLVLGVGMFFLRWGPTVVVLGAADAAWVVGLLRATPDFAWATFGFSLASATLLALLSEGLRLKAYSGLERLRLAERRRNHELEAAVEYARESESRFRSLVDASSEGVLVAEESRVIDHNPAFAAIAGWPKGEVYQRRLEDFFPEESLRRLREVGHRGTDTPLRLNLRRGDGQLVPVQVSVKQAPRDGRFVSILALRDLPTPRVEVPDAPPLPTPRARRLPKRS